MKVKCHNCGYEWDTSSDMNMVTCPSCGYKTPRDEEAPKTPKRKTESETHEEKVPTGVRNLNTKSVGIVAVVVAVIVGVGAGFMLLGGEEAGPTTAETATIRLNSIGGSAPVFAASPTYTGIENIYVVDEGSGYSATSEIQASDPFVVGTFTAGDGTKTVNVNPENDWSLVVKAQIHQDNVVGLNKENCYVYGSFSNNTNFSGLTENTLVSDNRWEVDSGIGTIEVQHLLDNSNNGYVLQADNSVDFSIDLWAYLV